MPSSSSAERQNGNCQTSLPSLNGQGVESPAYLRTEGLNMTGPELKVINVAGLLVEFGNKGYRTCRFFGSNNILGVREVIDRNYPSVIIELKGKDSGATSATFRSAYIGIRLIFQAHLPRE